MTEVKLSNLVSQTQLNQELSPLAKAIGLKANRDQVDQIGKEVTEVVECLDSGLSQVMDSVNRKILEVSVNLKNEVNHQIERLVAQQTSKVT